MIKKYSCGEFAIEVDYDNVLTYVGALYGHFGVQGLKITNTSGRDWPTMTIALTGDFITTQVRVYEGVANGTTVEVVPDRLQPDMKRLGLLDRSRNSEMRVRVSGGDDTFDVVTLPLKIYGRNHFAGEMGHFEELVAFVDPNHELVGRITSAVQSAETPDDADEFSALRSRVSKIYSTIKDLEIDYRDVFFRADKGQDINTHDSIDKERSGNGLDMALLVCACLEKEGIHASLIYFNSSVIVGAWIDEAPVPETPVVESAENIYELIAADRPLLVLVDPTGIATGKDFEDSNYSANKLLLGEEPRYLIDMQAARAAGVAPLPALKKRNETVAADESDEADESGVLPYKQASARNKTLAEYKENNPGEKLIIPRCADSFVVKAIIEAAKGMSFVLNAPAGTSRQEVVASIIANATAKGERVIYVAADAETKTATEKCVSAISDGNYEYISGDDAEASCVAARRKTADGGHVNDVIEKYFAIDGDELPMTEKRAARMDESHATDIADTLASLDDYTRMFGKHPSRLPLTGIYPRVKTSRGQARIEAFLEEYPRFEKRVRRRERSLLNRWLFHHDAMHYLERIEQWNTFRRLVVLDDKLTVDIDTISEAVARWHANRHLFIDWAPYADAVVTLNRLGALDTLDYFLAGNSGKAASNAFLKGYYHARAKQMTGKGTGAETCETDEANNALHVSMQVCNVEMLTVDQIGELDYKQNVGVVVIDGAWQIPHQALGQLIPIAAQIIVVGDTVMTEKDSVLACANEAELPEYGLKFASRPRHERLVAFRNKTFYDGNLFTFPSPDDRTPSVRLLDPAGCFDAATQTNEAEARAVVEEIEKYLGQCDKPLTVGVVAFTQAQCDLIERLCDSQNLHPVFIKTPQSMAEGAEECDVLVLSVTYAPDSDGRVCADFGCFDSRGGENFINRAIAPARREMTVVSSLRPSSIPEDEVVSYGARVLRRLIAYSIDPYSPLRGGDIAPAEVPATVGSIAEALKSRGYDVVTNVGEGPFKIDIAVVDPTGRPDYMFGVIVDGKNYEALPTERDRCVAMPDLLSRLGWKIKRVRAVDWFRDPDGVLARLLA